MGYCIYTSSKGAWPPSDVSDVRSKVTPASLRMASLDVRLSPDEVSLELAGRKGLIFLLQSKYVV